MNKVRCEQLFDGKTVLGPTFFPLTCEFEFNKEFELVSLTSRFQKFNQKAKLKVSKPSPPVVKEALDSFGTAKEA